MSCDSRCFLFRSLFAGLARLRKTNRYSLFAAFNFAPFAAPAAFSTQISSTPKLLQTQTDWRASSVAGQMFAMPLTVVRQIQKRLCYFLVQPVVVEC